MTEVIYIFFLYNFVLPCYLLRFLVSEFFLFILYILNNSFKKAFKVFGSLIFYYCFITTLSVMYSLIFHFFHIYICINLWIFFKFFKWFIKSTNNMKLKDVTLTLFTDSLFLFFDTFCISLKNKYLDTLSICKCFIGIFFSTNLSLLYIFYFFCDLLTIFICVCIFTYFLYYHNILDIFNVDVVLPLFSPYYDVYSIFKHGYNSYTMEWSK